MRPIYLTAALFVALAFPQAGDKRLVLSAHDRIDGPFGGEHHVSDLQVFGDGKVIYKEEGTKNRGGKTERSTYQVTIPSDEMRRLAELLESADIRYLPKEISSNTRPEDFFWQKTVEINGPDKTQKIQIENFYPFLNLDAAVYPNSPTVLQFRFHHL